MPKNELSYTKKCIFIILIEKMISGCQQEHEDFSQQIRKGRQWSFEIDRFAEKARNSFPFRQSEENVQVGKSGQGTFVLLLKRV